MDYDKYLKLQSFLEWFYEFRPQFFDDIPPKQKKLLQDTFYMMLQTKAIRSRCRIFMTRLLAVSQRFSTIYWRRNLYAKQELRVRLTTLITHNLGRPILRPVFFSSYLSILSDEITFCISIPIPIMLKFLPKL